MPDVITLLRQMQEDNVLAEFASDPLVSFGPPDQPLLGATLLPDRTVRSNTYTDRSVKFLTVIANDGARYSPAQKKGSGLAVADIGVVLGNQDIKRSLEADDYDALVQLLNTDRSLDTSIAAMIGWFDRAVIRPLEQIKEKHRWDAIVDAEVVRRGHNGYVEAVSYPDPAGHRANVGTVWTNNAIDPFDDIEATVQLLRDKGFEPNRIITSSAVVSVMTKNTKVKSRTGQALLQVDGSGTLSARYLSSSLREINNTLQGAGLPPIEVYDATYRTQRETKFFLKRKTMVILSTQRFDDGLFVPADTPGAEDPRFTDPNIGYTAIGIPTGYAQPGRPAFLNPYLTTKPPRIEAEAWQTTIPVIREPNAIAVLEAIYA
jgi:hypothetical protein